MTTREYMIKIYQTNEFIKYLEISRVQNGGRPPGRENRLLDVYNEKPVRVSARVLVPVKEHPRVRLLNCQLLQISHQALSI